MPLRKIALICDRRCQQMGQVSYNLTKDWLDLRHCTLKMDGWFSSLLDQKQWSLLWKPMLECPWPLRLLKHPPIVVWCNWLEDGEATILPHTFQQSAIETWNHTCPFCRHHKTPLWPMIRWNCPIGFGYLFASGCPTGWWFHHWNLEKEIKVGECCVIKIFMIFIFLKSTIENILQISKVLTSLYLTDRISFFTRYISTSASSEKICFFFKFLFLVLNSWGFSNRKVQNPISQFEIKNKHSRVETF